MEPSEENWLYEEACNYLENRAAVKEGAVLGWTVVCTGVVPGTETEALPDQMISRPVL